MSPQSVARRDRGRPRRDPAQRPAAARPGRTGGRDDDGRQGRRLRPRDASSRPRGPRRPAPTWLGVATRRRGARAARGRRHRPAAVLARPSPARTTAPAIDARRRRHGVLRRRARRDRRRRGRRPARPPASSSRSTPGCPAAARPLADWPDAGRRAPAPARRPAPGRSPASGRTSPAATSPTTPPTTPRRRPSARRSAVAEDGRAATRGPAPRQLRGRDPAPVGAASTWSAAGIASYGLDPAPGPHARPRPAAGDDGPRPARAGQADRRRAPASPTATPGSPTRATTRRPGAGRVRRRRAAPRRATPPRSLVDGKRRPIRGRVCMDQFVVDLGGDLPRAPATEVVLFGPGDRRRADRPGLGRGLRHHLLRDRHPDRRPADPRATSTRRTTDEHARHGSSASRPAPPSASPPPARRSASPASARDHRRRAGRRPTAVRRRCAPTPLTVVADDGVPLHVEVDELDAAGPARSAAAAPAPDADRGLRPRLRAQPGLLALPARGLPRPGPHGLLRPALPRPLRPLRPTAHATIEQLGRDLLRGPRRASSPEGPVVLVGHSMGGMTIVALAEQHPELFGDRVVGVGLISTTAGGARPAAGSCSRCCRPALGGAGRAAGRRRRWRAATAPSTACAGSAAPSRWSPPTSSRSATTCRRAYVEFVDEMLSATPFEVVAEFFPSFGTLDKFETVRGAGAGADRDHLRHRATSSPRSATAASCTRGSPARRCSSARAPATW